MTHRQAAEVGIFPPTRRVHQLESGSSSTIEPERRLSWRRPAPSLMPRCPYLPFCLAPFVSTSCVRWLRCRVARPAALSSAPQPRRRDKQTWNVNDHFTLAESESLAFLSRTSGSHRQALKQEDSHT
ncbi:hypothetical protein THAOC_18754 [Thalassiosira oceanica]|uniref:Uncharacterized protein n=1 Tax=Thalassiosira oceanica TaxID=159749 RepID=K0S7D1_THAOC|nr:hypothetical protein THAOC_18754 [Thalassiosira oceanica]|eukprot:EJK60834.1 hypothetical protein THAOC_18754 [Thalassiosira oceanica]